MEPAASPSPSAPLGPGDFFTGIGSVVEGLQRIERLVTPTYWLVNLFNDSVVKPIYEFIARFLVSTADLSPGGGDFTHMDAISKYEPVARAAANAALVAVLVLAGYRLMWSQSVRPHYSAHLVLPRVFLAFVLINFAMPLFQSMVAVNNVLCQVAVSGVGEDLKSIVATTFTDAAKDLGSGPGLTVITTAALLFGFLLLGLAYFIRYALLVVLAVTAPLAALAFVLPETHKYSREWGSLFVTSLFMQPLQLLVIAIAFTLEKEGGWPVRHVFALASLWIAFKVPGALHSASSVGTHATTEAKGHAGKLIKTLATKGVA